MKDKRDSAHNLITGEIASGRLAPAKTLACSHCGAQAQHYHHENYDMPLEVIPLCASCHRKIHAASSIGTQATGKYYLAVRMKESERQAIDALAADYGMDTSEFVRCALSNSTGSDRRSPVRLFRCRVVQAKNW